MDKHAAATTPSGGWGERGGVGRKMCSKGAQRGLGAAKAVYERMGGEEESSRHLKNAVRGERRGGGRDLSTVAGAGAGAEEGSVGERDGRRCSCAY